MRQYKLCIQIVIIVIIIRIRIIKKIEKKMKIGWSKRVRLDK